MLLVAASLAVYPANAQETTTTTTTTTAQQEEEEKANNIVRFGVGWLDPDGEGDVESINGIADVHLTADNASAFFLGYEGRLAPWFGLEFLASYAKPEFHAFPVDGSPGTNVEEKVYTATIGANFHVFSRARFDLYLGPMVGYSFFGDAFDNAFGYGAVLGADIGITKKGLALVAAIRYMRTDADTSDTPSSTVPYNPLLYQLGLGWRF
jgi:outer membrane protein W